MLTSATNHNPAIEEAAARAKASEERANQARGSLLPEVKAQVSYGMQQEDRVGGVSTNQVLNREFTFTQPLSLGDEWLNWKAAEAEARADTALALATVQDVGLAVVESYTGVLFAQERIKGLTKLEVNLKRQQRVARRLFEEGEGTKTGIAETNQRLANARSELSRARAELDGAWAQLVSLVPVQGRPMLAWPPEKLVKGQRKIAKVHPNIMEAEARLEQAEYRRRLAGTNLFPELSVNAASGQIKGDANGAQERWASRVMVNMSVPLFRGGRDMYGLRAAEADEESLRFGMERTIRDIAAQRDVARSNLEAARESLRQAIAAQKEQEIAIRGARLEFENGERSLRELLNAEEEYVQTDISVARSRRDLIVSRCRLKVAEGVAFYP